MLWRADVTDHDWSHVDSNAELPQSIVSYRYFLGFSYDT